MGFGQTQRCFSKRQNWTFFLLENVSILIQKSFFGSEKVPPPQGGKLNSYAGIIVLRHGYFPGDAAMPPNRLWETNICPFYKKVSCGTFRGASFSLKQQTDFNQAFNISKSKPGQCLPSTIQTLDSQLSNSANDCQLKIGTVGLRWSNFI